MTNNVKPSNPMKVITGPETRWSYANVWEPKSINLRYEYDQPLDDPETVLLIDSWMDQAAIDAQGGRFI